MVIGDIRKFFHGLIKYMDRFAEFHKCLGCVLGTLIAMQNQFSFDCRL